LKKLKSACLNAIDSTSVDVEATFTKGLPSFTIVGLANSSIQESKDRVKSALLTNEFKFPPLKLTINLSPSDIVKSGTHFDLAIALLIAFKTEKSINFGDFFVFGELGLNGVLKDTSSIFVLILSLAQQGLIKNVLVPRSCVEKISKISNINVYSVNTLNQAIDFFRFDNKESFKSNLYDFNHKFIQVDNKKYFYKDNYSLDFSDVKGQKVGIKAALIASAGNHNILFCGSPGCGKSMITKRVQYILPPSSNEEILEKAKLEALDTSEPSFCPLRVFRSPHHSSTKGSIFGGGSTSAKIGEIALSNNGILFFDELPHFGKPILEALREPLEDHKILISRVNSKTNYPTKFMFIGAFNPCPCGNLLSSTKNCICNDIEINRYKNRLSEPFLDRMDLFVTMNETKEDDKNHFDSQTLHKRVLDAFSMQKSRGQIELNGKLSDEDIKKYCILDDESTSILNKATTSYNLSFRGINKVMKVSRTLADLSMSKIIQKSHLLEALSYRKR
jgi:magnesium chelatase family protein